MRLCNCQNDVAAQEHGEHFRTCLTLSFSEDDNISGKPTSSSAARCDQVAG